MDVAPLALLAGGVVLGAWMTSSHLRWRDRLRRRQRAHRALGGEAAAETLARQHGWRVLGRQVERSYTLVVDGAPRTFKVRVDLLLSRGGRRAVGETKTGARVARLEHGPTRRQLIEYGLVFEAEEVVLIDVERRKLTSVEVPRLPARTPPSWFSWSLAVGVAVTAALILLIGA
ncbi:MAG: hypothetical protein AAFU79_04745 [Myxococcota bacterium]